MIKNKKDYNRYLLADEKVLGIETKGIKNRLFYIINVLLFIENYVLLYYTKALRKAEYLKNTKEKVYLNKIRYVFANRKLNRLSTKLQIHIPVNTVSEGLLILHLGYIVVNYNARIGKYATFQPGSVIGQIDLPENVPAVGDNVVFAPGAVVIGKINVDSNVYICPNSVVVKDLPDNCVVSGIPAKIIKLNGEQIYN